MQLLHSQVMHKVKRPQRVELISHPSQQIPSVDHWRKRTLSAIAPLGGDIS